MQSNKRFFFVCAGFKKATKTAPTFAHAQPASVPGLLCPPSALHFRAFSFSRFHCISYAIVPESVSHVVGACVIPQKALRPMRSESGVRGTDNSCFIRKSSRGILTPGRTGHLRWRSLALRRRFHLLLGF